MMTLWWREWIRFFRQPSRIVGMLSAPLVFWLLIGSGLGSSFQPPAAGGGSHYLEYFFPGTVVMVVLFASALSMMSVIEDRHAGFLLSVLVAPIPRSSLVLGKILGGATQAFLPGFLFLLLAPAIGFSVHPAQFFWLAVILFWISFSLTSMGFIVAWKMDSAQGFHSVLNLVLIPMWLLSGALFPASGASAWIQWIMRLNPLTYGVAALRRMLYGNSIAVSGDVAPLGLSLEITALFGLLLMTAAILWTGRPSAKDLA
ncbi:MAG: ABC transporter permease [Acidobacteria bacterium]|nr:ABC transporter permease [Acidobacteriota bacterium]